MTPENFILDCKIYKLLLPVTGFPLASVTVIDLAVLVNTSVTGFPLASIDYMIYNLRVLNLRK